MLGCNDCERRQETGHAVKVVNYEGKSDTRQGTAERRKEKALEEYETDCPTTFL